MTVIVALNAQSRRGVGLRIAVNQERLQSLQSEARREIDGRGGLADATLLIDDSDDLSHGIPE
jgi:hypothetical protein